MRYLNAIFLMLWLPMVPRTQTLPFEILVGHNNTFYQHAVGKTFPGSERLGWLNIASVLVRYDRRTDEQTTDRRDEIMNQTYLVYRPWKNLAVLGGGFYTDATRFRLSAALHWTFSHKTFNALLAPRADLVKKGSLELFGLFEYKPGLGPGPWYGYTRLQFMTNHGRMGHSRSYEQFRIGAGIHDTQFGVGMTLDQYGRDPASQFNAGVFIRRVF